MKRGQTRNNRVRERREYLLSMAALSALACVGLILCVVCTLLVMCTGSVCAAGIMVSSAAGALEPRSLLPLLAPALSGLGAILALEAVQYAEARANGLPHVPPIRAEIAPLPAEQVLVRGASQPVRAESLLRAAPAGCARPGAELLRAPRDADGAG